MIIDPQSVQPKRASDKELERRWKAIREAMQDKGLDFLIFQSSISTLHGYIKWFTDLNISQEGYPATVIFPRGEQMTTIWHGPRPPEEPAPPANMVRGVKKRISVPIIHSLNYSSIFDAEKVVEELAPYKNARIGLVGMGFISAAFYQYLTRNLNTVRFEDATDLVDNIKAIKSEEEITHIRETCAIEDAILAYTITRVKPGRTAREIHAEILAKSIELGVQVVANIRSRAVRLNNSGAKAETVLVLQKGDIFTVALETDGPGAQWCEFGRNICLGKVPAELEEQLEIAKEAQQVTLDLLKPGTDPLVCWEANNEFMRKHGLPEERRIYAHGQGYDMVERPSLNPGETMKIQAGMNMAVHPSIVNARSRASAGGNVLVTKTGLEFLHKTPKKIFEA